MGTQALRELATRHNLEIFKDAVFTVDCLTHGETVVPAGYISANSGRAELDGELCTKCPECGDWCNLPPATGRGGWFWWSCSPGCLPDGEPTGPFETERDALESATQGLDE